MNSYTGIVLSSYLLADCYIVIGSDSLSNHERYDMTKNVEAREILGSRVETLYQEVELIVSSYWDAVLKMEKEKKDAQYRNRLRLRSVKEKNSIRAEWQGIVWTGKGKDGKLFDKKEHISKPAGSFSYTLSRLYKFAHDWEKELIEETEVKLTGIRKEAHHLTRALISLGHAEAAEVKRKAGDEKEPS